MKKTILAFALIVLCGCSHVTTTSHEGKNEHVILPQAVNQCIAQPELPWCRK